MRKKPISADSHVIEPPQLYADFIDPAFRDRVPHYVNDPNKGDLLVIPGSPQPLSMGLIAAAGKDPKTLRHKGWIEELPPGGWDPHVRMADQDRDGIGGEIVYPTIGMVLCAHPDSEFRRACFIAYNRWLSEFVGGEPGRLWGIGQLNVDQNIDRMLKDLEDIKARGFKGVLLPAAPENWETHDYDDPVYDPVWQALSDLALPLSFHIATGNQYMVGLSKPRGPRITQGMSIIRMNQDLLMMMVFSGVFDRNPRLKCVSVEADAGWVPHFAYRMDHIYEYQRYWNRATALERRPSEYIHDHFYFTCQDDRAAFLFKDHLNLDHLLWATDFPHSDSTWPRSMEVLEKHTRGVMSDDERNRVVHDNVVELYSLYN